MWMRFCNNPAMLALCGCLLLALTLGGLGMPAAQATTYYASPTGAGNGLTQGTPFRISNFLTVAAAGDILVLLDGTYQGSSNMLTPASGLNGSSGNRITVKALNDGGVFLDGQFARMPLKLNNNSWWDIEGIDVGNSSAEALFMQNANNNILRRVCAFNANPPAPLGTGTNIHTMLVWDSADNLFEDLCLFGYGRNSYNDFGGGAHRNTMRRAWMRWDGWNPNNGGSHPGPALQTSYGTPADSLYENLILVWGATLYRADLWGADAADSLGMIFRDGPPEGTGTPGYRTKGVTVYGYDNALLPGLSAAQGGIFFLSRWVPSTFVDLFVDGRSQATTKTLALLCDVQHGDLTYTGGQCGQTSVDRITTLHAPGSPASMEILSGSNTNECTTPGACPTYYTGTPGAGSRACFSYVDGTLTTTPLWPWPMDARIKAALSRAGAQGLAGAAGTGYAAGTVTSEIVSRYGAPPSVCTRTGAPPPTATNAWWKMDEGTGTSAADATGNGNTLALSAGLTWQPGRVGPFSLHCDGVGGFAQLDTPFSSGAYTFLAWIKGTAAPSAINEHVVMNGLTNETWGLSWGHGDPAFQQAWQHRDGGGNYWAAKLTTPLVGGVWYHIAASYDGSNIRIYLNGTLQATTSVPSMMTVAGAFTVCGSGIETPFAGNLDHAKVWNRQLSDAEVRQEFANTAGTVRHKAFAVR
jgi:hypothetical protein